MKNIAWWSDICWTIGLLRSKVGVLFFCLRVQFSRRESAQVDVKSNLKVHRRCPNLADVLHRRARPEQTLSQMTAHRKKRTPVLQSWPPLISVFTFMAHCGFIRDEPLIIVGGVRHGFFSSAKRYLLFFSSATRHLLFFPSATRHLLFFFLGQQGTCFF